MLIQTLTSTHKCTCTCKCTLHLSSQDRVGQYNLTNRLLFYCSPCCIKPYLLIKKTNKAIDCETGVTSDCNKC